MVLKYISINTVRNVRKPKKIVCYKGNVKFDDI